MRDRQTGCAQREKDLIAILIQSLGPFTLTVTGDLHPDFEEEKTLENLSQLMRNTES